MTESATRRMLVVMAHPDDESFGMAGTIAKCVAEGVQVSLICATNGDVGTVEPEFMKGYSTIAEMRLAELQCAANTLGLAHLKTFGYRDSGMEGSPDNKHPDSLVSANLNQVAGRITEAIRELRPQVVVTFDPYGGYGHPDHIATHRATLMAFESAADSAKNPEQLIQGLKAYQPQKLYFMTFDRRIFKLVIGIMSVVKVFGDPARMGRNKDMDARKIAANSFPIHAVIDTRKHQQIAAQARQCHASQLGGIGPRNMSQVISAIVFGVRENYMRYFPEVTGRVRERDLFEGVTAD